MKRLASACCFEGILPTCSGQHADADRSEMQYTALAPVIVLTNVLTGQPLSSWKLDSDKMTILFSSPRITGGGPTFVSEYRVSNV